MSGKWVMSRLWYHSIGQIKHIIQHKRLSTHPSKVQYIESTSGDHTCDGVEEQEDHDVFPAQQFLRWILTNKTPQNTSHIRNRKDTFLIILQWQHPKHKDSYFNQKTYTNKVTVTYQAIAALKKFSCVYSCINEMLYSWQYNLKLYNCRVQLSYCLAATV